jgi:hypothetical protein
MRKSHADRTFCGYVYTRSRRQCVFTRNFNCRWVYVDKVLGNLMEWARNGIEHVAVSEKCYGARREHLATNAIVQCTQRGMAWVRFVETAIPRYRRSGVENVQRDCASRVLPTRHQTITAHSAIPYCIQRN